MRNRKLLFISILLFMVVLSIGAISAEDADNATVSDSNDVVLSESNSVSGGVDVVTENPWDTSGELTYDIPEDAKTIKSADVYVSVYNGRADNTYGVNANITITTDNDNVSYYEPLWITEGSADGTVYTVNDHTTKCYSDFMIHYDVTDMLDGLNGTNLKINVNTFEMEGKDFDGRIKLIALILAYDDGDEDSISYWINDDQLWTKENVTITFDTGNVTQFTDAYLRNVVLSSGDGTYIMNGDDFLGDADVHVSGDYYQYNEWDVTEVVKANQVNTLQVLNAGTGAWGSIKNVLSVLTISNMVPLVTEISLASEYNNVAYAGTNNTLTVNVQTSKAGKYDFVLYADGVEVDGASFDLVEGANTILLTDPTIRAVDASTVNGAENNMVNYTVELYYKGDLVDSNAKFLSVLYNGNLGSDLEFNITGFDDDAVTYYINGDFIVNIKDVGSYLSGSAMTRTDVWEIELDDNSEITNAFIYVPYNWFNSKTYTEDINMFNVTFNGYAIAPVAWYRDQSNLGTYGKYGYGVLVYDVSGLAANGNNSFVLNKVNPTPAVYPSALIYMYNTTGSIYDKTVTILNGADLLANTSNAAGRIAKSDSEITIGSTDVDSAILYVLAASAQAGESDIVFNDEVFSNVWSGTSSTTDLFFAEVTDLVNDTNSISFVATGSTILALPQIIVTSVYAGPETELSLTPEYTSVPSAYAGTNNTITIKVKTDTEGNYTVVLLADGVEVDSVDVALVEGDNTILLTDPTIRAVDASTVNGAENNEVTYIGGVIYNGIAINIESITLPVLYNGNLGSDYEFNITGFEEVAPITVTGDIVIDVQDAGSYLGASAMNRTDVWEIYLDDDSTITNAYVYVPYNWFNAKTYTEDINMFNVTFNGAAVTPVAWYRDQGNLGNYGKYGYGVLVYDVTDWIAVGDNEFVLNKINPTPAVYPSVLVYMYNDTGSLYSTTVSILNGADLLSNANNNAGRIVSADIVIAANPDDITDAILYVLAAGAQAGESDIVFNGEVYSNVWSGTSSTTNLFFADVTDLVNDTNSISFVATGSTILALPQFIVTSTYVGPKTEVSLATEYTSVPCVYAGTNNTLTVKVKTDRAGNYTVFLLADGVVVDSADVALVEGDNTVLLTDPTIRPVDASTVNGAENNEVDYNVWVSYNGVDINYQSISLPVLYNGNLGSDYEYNITGFDDEAVTYYINGDLVIDIKDAGSYLGSSAMTRTDVWEIDLDNNSEITNAFIYVPYNWFNAKTYTEDINMFNVTFNGYAIAPVAWYRDQGNLGNYGKYGYGVLVYDVSGLAVNGNNSFVLNKVNPTPAVYPSVLMYMYNTTLPLYNRTVAILNGADLLSNSNNVAGRIVKADTEIAVYSTDYTDDKLYVLAAGAQAGESDIVFNGKVFSNVWSGTSSTTDLFVADVFVEDINSISFVATGSTILALPQILVTSVYAGPQTEVSLATEYTSVPCVYAGTNNTLTVNVKTDRAGNYTVSLFADYVEVDSVDVALVEGDNTVLLTDPTIRAVDASTVNGAENNDVFYEAYVYYDGLLLSGICKIFPILYNGNLPSEYEFNITGFDDEAVTYYINGDLVIDIKDAGSYLGSSAMNRTDVWTVDLDNTSEITNAFIYVPYNWFNAKTYTEDINMFDVTFNGVNVTPVAWYRDQGNLGNYGKYGYGLLIYDVSSLLGTGDNSFVLNKRYPTPAVYPSALIYMYNTTDSQISKTVTILNGADLLSNANNNAGRIVQSDTVISVDYGNIDGATLYVLAAGAQAGESDIIFNGEVYKDVWSGTSSTTDLFSKDVTNLIDDTNSISFVATGSTILQLPQIIVTSKDRQDTVLSIDDVVVIGNSTANVVATLTDDSGNALSDIKVKIVVGTLSKIARTDANGQVSMDISSLEPGEYKISARSAVTDIYNEAKATAVAIISEDKLDAVLEIPDVIAVGNSSAVVVATLTDEYGNVVSGVKVKLVAGELSKIARTDANGQVSMDISTLGPGEYKISSRSGVTDIYNEAKATAKAIISEDIISTTLTIPDVIVVGNSTAPVVATLTDEYGNAVSGVKVKLVVGELSKIARTDANGEVTLDISGLKPGEYKISARSATTDIYSEAKATAKAIISEDKLDAILEIPDVDVKYGDTGAIAVATLTDEYGNIVEGVKVKLVVGNMSKIARTDANGQVSMDLSGLEPGEYKISARSGVTDIYNEAKAKATATISKIDLTFEIPDVIVVGNSSATVVATLTDEYGNVVSGFKVKLVVGDLSKITRTDANGQVSMDISGLEPGEYKIGARSAVTDVYNEAKAYATAIVSEDKLDAILEIPDVEVQYGDAGAIAVATLKNSLGNVVEGVKVKLVVGNMSKIARTDANGQVSMDLSSFLPGEYKISARSAVTDIYNEAKAHATATINKIDPTLEIPDVEFEYGVPGAAAVATLKDSDGNAISDVKVKIVVGDLARIARTDANGQVSIDISSLAPGEYKISARSAITDIYNEAKVSAKATIVVMD